LSERVTLIGIMVSYAAVMIRRTTALDLR